MAEFYLMPAVSPTMEVGTLVAWRVAEGSKFEPQTVLAEVGTDKANMEAEIFDAGVLIKHLIDEGDEVPAGFPIAIWGQSTDEDIAGLVAEYAKQKATLDAGGPGPAEDAPAADAPTAGSPAPQAEPTPTIHTAPEPSRPAPAPTAPPPPPRVPEWMGKPIAVDFMEPPGDIRAATVERRIAASPLARAVADDLGVDLRRVSGSGPGGRIVRADVEKAAATGVGTTAVARDDRVVRNSPMRKTIARRLLASHQDVPTFFLTVTYDMQGFVDFRAALKLHRPDAKVSYNDLLIKCVARALVDCPEVNASWDDKSITHHGRVDIGVAVAVKDGLITPVARNADSRSIFEIADDVRALAGRARKGQLLPEEYTGATFTISNLGMMDIREFTAIINPPESAILAVGEITQVPVVVDGRLAVGWRMNITMTCDHRVIDGAVGANFLQVLRRYVEAPALALL